MKLPRNLASSLAAVLATPALASAPFDSCPSEAFLVQDSVARLYGVDLSTGYYNKLSTSMGVRNKLNAIGFNYHDAYLYAWSYAHKTLARIGSDYQVQPLKLGFQPNSNYYVGDVSVVENAYYMYHKGGSEAHGLWRIGLDPEAKDYLTPSRIRDGSSLYLNIFDLAFHPEQQMMYSVDSRGRLLTVDPETGKSEIIGDVGERGTFGAVYFDVDGRLYISRNQDGVIFQIDVSSAKPTARKYAQGPASANNDGARCALAPVVPVDQDAIDFGDAPESYNTTLDANGARHSLEGSSLRLGKIADGESQAYPAPLADDTTGEDDEDGVGFITELAAGETALIEVTASGAGFLNAWIDFDRNGRFDAGEQVASGQEVTAGSNLLSLSVPVWTQPGNSWSRFRLSSVANLGTDGGAPDGEVEDHPVTLFNGGVTTSHYPSADSFVTLAFEDLWPSRGDYDMNDLVLHYRTAVSTINNGDGPEDAKLVSISISGEFTAVGASFHSGFAVAIPGLRRADAANAEVFFEINGEPQDTNPLENSWNPDSDAIYRITRDVWDQVTTAEGCSFYRTEANCGGSGVQARFSLNVRFTDTVSAAPLDDGLFNPFIFATTGHQRNSIFKTPPGRGLEIHLKNRPPSIHADRSLLGRADDRSTEEAGLTYQTEEGLPWALEVGMEWQHPREYQDLVQTYPDFIQFVLSGGKTHQTWYLPEKAVQEKLYKD
ncbi:MAG: LruC domain-containing protein [Halieaceae bacterium]|jgi:LruC domain-containing protein|nr:LruC domain-containing protein [Halieaceae bacterium]